MRPFGYDYAIKPSYSIKISDRFTTLLRSGLLALGYSVLPVYGAYRDVPVLAMIFRSAAICRECFGLFRQWCNDDPEDGDNVKISFIELPDEGDYLLCVYPELERLAQRVIDESIRDEVLPLLAAPGHRKTFPLSPHYAWFKQAARNREWILAPADPNGRIFADLGLLKREVTFYSLGDIPTNSMEAALIGKKNAYDSQLSSDPATESLPDLGEMKARRRTQLSRFFPVTLELLRFDANFNHILHDLVSEGYREWQIEQAGCNLSLRQHILELFAQLGDVHDAARENLIELLLLGHLIKNYEDCSKITGLHVKISRTSARDQIRADSRSLLSYCVRVGVIDSFSNRLQNELARLHLLGDS
jgi:hypothetical protein